jgi:hypothetical protein
MVAMATCESSKIPKVDTEKLLQRFFYTHTRFHTEICSLNQKITRGYPRKAQEICSLNPEDCADTLGIQEKFAASTKSAALTKRIARLA